MLDAYQQPLEQLQPIVARLSETTSPAEVDAMVALLDTLPNIAYKLDRDVLPVLDTLGTVAPDLRDLLDVSKQLNVMLSAIPGLGRIKKQIDERQEQDDAYRGGRGAAERTGSVWLTTPTDPPRTGACKKFDPSAPIPAGRGLASTHGGLRRSRRRGPRARGPATSVARRRRACR